MVRLPCETGIDTLRVDGTYSDRTDSRTPTTPSDARIVGGGSASGPKNNDDCWAPGPHGIQ